MALALVAVQYKARNRSGSALCVDSWSAAWLLHPPPTFNQRVAKMAKFSTVIHATGNLLATAHPLRRTLHTCRRTTSCLFVMSVVSSCVNSRISLSRSLVPPPPTSRCCVDSSAGCLSCNACAPAISAVATVLGDRDLMYSPSGEMPVSMRGSPLLQLRHVALKRICPGMG